MKPNSASGQAEIREDHGVEISSLHVKKMMGQQVLQKHLASKQHISVVDVSNLVPAVYLVKVRFSDGKLLTEKLIISR